MQFDTKSVLTFAALAALGLAAHPAMAQGSLNGTYYQAPGGTTSSVAQAQAYMNTNGASGYFTSTESTLATGYTGQDDTLITSFLGTDGVSFTGTPGNLSDGIISLNGDVIVSTPGTYSFSTTSDDGSAMFIDGTEVVNNDGNHLSQTVTNTATLSTGQHSVNIVYYDHGFLPTFDGQANFGATFGGLTTSPVPEPSSVAAFALTGLGAAGLMLKARKRRVLA
jgi:hypothetical protein